MDTRHLPMPGCRIFTRRCKRAPSVRASRVIRLRELRHRLEVRETEPAKIRRVESALPHDVAERVAARISVSRRVGHLAYTNTVQHNPDDAFEHDAQCYQACPGRLRNTTLKTTLNTTLKSMTGADFRRIALSMPEAAEGAHFGNADFRVGGRIFATLSLESQGFGVLLLTPEQQSGMVEDAPEVFSPVPGGWGRAGSTRVNLGNVTSDVLESALRTAWQRRLAMNNKSKPRKK
jgi:hypothetical protein